MPHVVSEQEGLLMRPIAVVRWTIEIGRLRREIT